MKIAVFTKGNLVAKHYGKAPEFVISDIITGEVVDTEKFLTEDYTKDEIIDFLSKKQVRRIICNCIGAKAAKLYEERGIQVIAGISGEIKSVLESVTNGTIIAGGESPCIPGTGAGYLHSGKKCEHATEECFFKQLQGGFKNANR